MLLGTAVARFFCSGTVFHLFWARAEQSGQSSLRPTSPHWFECKRRSKDKAAIGCCLLAPLFQVALSSDTLSPLDFSPATVLCFYPFFERTGRLDSGRFRGARVPTLHTGVGLEVYSLTYWETLLQLFTRLLEPSTCCRFVLCSCFARA